MGENAEEPESFTIDYGCQVPELGALEFVNGETATVDDIRADPYCIVAERAADLPEGTEVSYTVNGAEPELATPRGFPVFQVTLGTTVDVVVTNTIPAECPEGQAPDPDDPTVRVRDELPDTGSDMGMTPQRSPGSGARRRHWHRGSEAQHLGVPTSSACDDHPKWVIHRD